MDKNVKEDLRGLFTQITASSNQIQAVVSRLPRGNLRMKAQKADVHLLSAREYVEQILTAQPATT